jgi:cell shape-determining protein MreC
MCIGIIPCVCVSFVNYVCTQRPSFFESFLSTFEKQMDSVLTSVDNAATNAVNYIANTIETSSSSGHHREEVPHLFGTSLKVA